MSIANVIKGKKKRKIIKDTIAKQKVDKKVKDLDKIRKDGTTAESWDWKRQSPRIDEPYKEQYRKKKAKKLAAREPAMEGVSKQTESKPAKRLKRAKPEGKKQVVDTDYLYGDWLDSPSKTAKKKREKYTKVDEEA